MATLSVSPTRGDRRPAYYRFQRRVVFTVLLLVIALGSAIFALPFVWMLSTSLKASEQVYAFPPVWIPQELRWENYVEGWTRVSFPTFYRNTLFIVVLNQVGALFSNALVAFGFARLRFRGRNFLFLLMLSTLMLPSQVTLIPTYFLFSKLGWVNTFRPLIVPVYFGSAFNIFLLRQYFMTISHELDDAAKIDGCGYWGTFWRIIVPLSAPALGVVAIFQFTYDWNNFFEPLIYINSPKLFPVALGLRMLQGTLVQVPVQQIMAMTLVSIIPVLLVFVVAQHRFIQGIVVTGVKG